MALFNSFTFDDENSLDSGIYITGEAVFNAPKRVVEMVNVPGRNGAIAIDEGRFENIPVKYPAGCFADNMADFAEKVANFRNILASRFTYKRLEDTYYPDEFRMGLYRSGLEVDVVNQARAGKFDIEFDCKPQRFLKSGEIPVEYTPGQTPSDEQTKTGSIVTFEAEEGTIISDVKADINPIQDLHGYDKPWAGGNGKNILNITNFSVGQTKTVGGVSCTYNGDGTFTLNGTTTQANVFFNLNYISSSAHALPTNAPFNIGYATENNTGALVRIEAVGGTGYSNVTFGSSAAFGISDDIDRTTTTTTSSWARLQIQNSGVTLTNVKIRPFVCMSSNKLTAYEPYENICPISGWDNVNIYRTGRNFLENGYTGSNTVSGVTFTANSDGSISLSGTATATFVGIGNLATGLIGTGAGQNDGKKHVPNGRWKVPYTGNNGVRLQVTGTNSPSGVSEIGTIFSNSQGTFTVDDTYKYNWVRLYIVNGTVCDGITLYPMILREDDTSTAYEPYQGDTYTIDLNGTRYGGTLDVTTGVLTVTMASIDLGTDGWRAHSNSGRFYFRASASDNMKPAATGGSVGNILCERYNTVSQSDLMSSDGTISIDSSVPPFVNIHDSTFEGKTATTVKNALTGVPLIYELAEPITVQLTPTEVSALLGVNNVWADSGDITVKYGTSPYIIVNPTDFPSKPLLEVTGVGSFWLGDTQITITGTSGQVIFIDCEIGECYKEAGGIISPANGLVTLNRLDFPELAPGINNIQLGSGISKVKITPRWWMI